MKRKLPLILGLGIVILIAVAAFNRVETVEYFAPEVIEKEVHVETHTLEMQQEAAWKDREDDARIAAQAAYDEVMRIQRTESDLEVVRSVQTELDELEVQLMASSSFPQTPTQ